MKRLIQNVFLACFTTLVTLLTAEAAARIILDPVDFLTPARGPHPELRWRVEPNSAGHDALGFRNRRIPDRTRILAIGDSQTYGNEAKAQESFPAWIETIHDTPTYNMGLGGYGALDYLYLFRELSPKLRPETVVIGLYLGNDLRDAFRSAYGKDSWSSWRNKTEIVPKHLWPTTDGDLDSGLGLFQRARQWPGRHSVLYGVAALRLRHFVRPDDVWHTEGLVPVSDETGTSVTILDPTTRIKQVDLTDRRVEEGLRLTIAALDTLAQEAAATDTELLIAIIPTKVRVYGALQPFKDGRVERLVTLEDVVKGQIVDILTESEIQHVDLLPALVEAAETGRPYPSSVNGHPNAAGYKAMAQAIGKKLGLSQH